MPVKKTHNTNNTKESRRSKLLRQIAEVLRGKSKKGA